MTTPAMSLEAWLGTQRVPAALRSLAVTGLGVDSRALRVGEAFIALPGRQFDGSRFMADAARRGAAVILLDPACAARAEVGVPVLEIPELARQLPALARRFFGDPAAGLRLAAITGTNGKTTCSHFLSRALTALGTPTGVVGTNGYGPVDRLQPVGHTTPDVASLQRMLFELQSSGCRAVAMEVSSHALDQGRVEGLRFAYGLLTNLTRDHLDYHGSMAAYGEAKRRLFTDYRPEVSLINRDDPFGESLLEELGRGDRVLAYSLDRVDADLRVRRHRYTEAGLSAAIDTPWGTLDLEAPLYGAFNLTNLLGVIGVLGLEGHPLARIGEVLRQLSAVEGRMQRFGSAATPQVVIDYAHTPDALEQALAGLRRHARGRLWCLFGCGGDRDRGKRPMMGAVAARLADRVLVTSDNPRSEPPEAIIEEILGGLDDTAGVAVEPDRAAAIRQAIEAAEPGDLVLVAGKGHETYQEIAGVRHPFSDRQAVEQALREREGRP